MASYKGHVGYCARVRHERGELMEYKDLTPEQKEKARACKTPEEMLALAQEEGYDLTDEELEVVSGGGFWSICSDHDATPDF